MVISTIVTICFMQFIKFSFFSKSKTVWTAFLQRYECSNADEYCKCLYFNENVFFFWKKGKQFKKIFHFWIDKFRNISIFAWFMCFEFRTRGWLCFPITKEAFFFQPVLLPQWAIYWFCLLLLSFFLSDIHISSEPSADKSSKAIKYDFFYLVNVLSDSLSVTL